jgi:hypothetical protein
MKNSDSKESLKEYRKDYYEKNKGKFKEYWNRWYLKNREIKIQYTIKNLQINNYSYEKTPKQKAIRYIKNRTRKLFPLDNKTCEFCGDVATEHHHYTNPIEIDKFNFVCHRCHNDPSIIIKKEVF